MPLWDPTHPGPLYQGGVGREEGRPSDRQDHHGAMYLKAVQVMPRDVNIFLSRVLTVPRTEHLCPSGILHILALSTKEELDERRLNPGLDKKGVWQQIHSNSKSEFCDILPRISVGPHLYAPLGSYTFCTKISISEYLS